MEEECLEDLLSSRQKHEDEERAFQTMLEKISWHVAPAVQVGFGASSLERKLHAILHALRLELSSHEELVAFWRQVMCITTDYGTEYKVCYCRPVPDMFPWWQDSEQTQMPALDDDVLEAPQREHLPFDHLLPNDGILHCIDNCTKDLAAVMPGVSCR